MSASLEEYLKARRAVVEEHLDRWLVSPPASPPVISEVMRYSLLGGGKRFRPLLALAAAETVALTPRLQAPPDHATSEHEALSLALPAGCAIEMIHTYSLVHDDLPAMDNDTLRRGRPTLHVVHGEGMAILGGDGLLTEAFVLMATRPDRDSAAVLKRRLRALAEVAEAAGAAGMVGGQALDLAAVGSGGAASVNGDVARFTIEGLRDMHARKTGALIRAAAVCGAVMAGGTDEAIEGIRAYAVGLGLAFQIVDDILDVEGATADLGKTSGKDAAAGKPTYPAFFGVSRSRELAADAMGQALDSLRRLGIPDGRLHDFARWVTGRHN